MYGSVPINRTQSCKEKKKTDLPRVQDSGGTSTAYARYREHHHSFICSISIVIVTSSQTRNVYLNGQTVRRGERSRCMLTVSCTLTVRGPVPRLLLLMPSVMCLPLLSVQNNAEVPTFQGFPALEPVQSLILKVRTTFCSSDLHCFPCR